jgi:hypothetical protein
MRCDFPKMLVVLVVVIGNGNNDWILEREVVWGVPFLRALF